ncbi:MAG: tRNA-dihydrouridine synthase family protein [Ellagibacter isourolithinifaciens]|uniref:tRNA dihydrouridine synthase n=1 Tax=Ellagibacter isourolithinifaciens TaxID=2137581 RepID=UPI002E778305|nr:tRNA-dihydrouridine synthase family protein [Ellagibacter isourolithinifaciens]MEE1453849.1 tRNA-dihydrouridine synthase family protein [Ellagibacter isourolithinifaciens]
MLLSLAPMEGITGYAFRRVHAEVFGALDRYYTPFISPLPKVGTPFSKRNSRELDPANNQGLDVVPQLLTNDADRFAWAAGLLADMGYKEVNLNLGCPSGTVVAKEKGSGLLRNPDRLEAFLANVCERSPLPVSVKTRVGIANGDEYGELLELFCRCGIAELIVHPRVQKDFYSGSPRQELYGKTLELAPFPVAYNGDIFTLGDYDELLAAYPQTRHIMLGRGIVANPALARMIRGGEGLTREELERFHDKLYESCTDDMGGNAVFRMKEWWSYAEHAFADPPSVHRIMRKTRRADEYEAAARKIFSTESLADSPRFS